MFKFIWKQRKALACGASDWRHDPLGHPALTRMSPRELADLPMVAEVPMQVAEVEAQAQVAHGRRHGFGKELSARCAVS
eukprot:gene2014-2360_t